MDKKDLKQSLKEEKWGKIALYTGLLGIFWTTVGYAANGLEEQAPKVTDFLFGKVVPGTLAVAAVAGGYLQIKEGNLGKVFAVAVATGVIGITLAVIKANTIMSTLG